MIVDTTKSKMEHDMSAMPFSTKVLMIHKAFQLEKTLAVLLGIAPQNKHVVNLVKYLTSNHG